MGPVPRTPRKRPADALGALSVRIMGLARFYQLRGRDRVCRHGVTVGQCYALEAVVFSGELSVTELGRQLSVNKSNASRVADALVGLGFCRFTSVRGNARIKRIVPTLAGVSLFERIHGEIRSEHRRALRHVPVAEVIACERVLAALETHGSASDAHSGRGTALGRRRGRGS